MTKNQYEKLVIIRSAVPTRDIGFLPGTEKEKAQCMKSLTMTYLLICSKGAMHTRYSKLKD